MSYAKPPILGGSAKSDYENYVRTDELLSLQKGPDEWVHRDELLFTVVHQSSELWLKLATCEIGESISQLEKNEILEACRLISRAVLCVDQTYHALDMLEKMSPSEYQQVRLALGHGSGFDSPGFNQLRKEIPTLEIHLDRILAESNTTLVEIYRFERKHKSTFQLAESMMELDQKMALWRFRHLQVIARTIGVNVAGTQGTPVEILSKLSSFVFFPKLRDVRNSLTKIYDLERDG